MSSLLLYICLLLVFHQVYTQNPIPSSSPIGLNLPGLFKTNQSCNKYNNTIQGCSDDCTSIKMCVDNQKYLINCKVQSYGRNPYCNQSSNMCQSAPVRCRKLQQHFECPERDGFYPDAFDCKRYYQCSNGKPYEGNCTLANFNPKDPGCKRAIPCYSFSMTNGLCRRKFQKIIVHPLDKNIYVYCDEYPLILRCPINHIFNLKSVSCEYECKSPGVFPDKENYSWYYECQWNLQAIHKKCPIRTYFNENFRGCILL